MDKVWLSVDWFCLLVGIEALQEMEEEDAAVCGARHRHNPDRQGYRWDWADLTAGIGCCSSAQSAGERRRRISSSCFGLVKRTVSVPPRPWVEMATFRPSKAVMSRSRIANSGLLADFAA